LNWGRVVWTPQIGALAASGALVIGSLGPWETSTAGTQWGVEAAGLYTLLLALAAGLLSIPKKPWPTAVFLLGVLCFTITTVNVVDIAGSTREPAALDPPATEIDWGLWLATLSSLALAWAALSLRRDVEGRPARSPRSQTGAVGWVKANPALFGLLVLLVLGLVLRIWLTLAWSPAFTGYSDSGIYFQGAFESIWADPIRMVGYSMFLEAVHVVSPHLVAVVIVQHAMGLAAAALIFFAVRRCGGPPWLGLVPAAVLALGGDELFIEHAALSDALFVFLIVTTLYATIRASEDGGWWAVLAGLSAGLAVWDRTVGLGLVAIVSLWLVFNAGRPTRPTLIAGALCLVFSLATIGVYAGWRSAAADLPGTLTSNNAWNLYGRVAPWADCQKFDPPAGTEGLCQNTPASQRGYHSGEEYIYSPESLAQQLYGPPYLLPADPTAMDRVQEWSEAALRGQPLDYLNAVWLDTRRLFSPNTPSYSQLSADLFIAYLLYGVTRSGENEFVESWQSNLYPDDSAPHHGNIEAFKTWEAMTRIANLPMALMLALCLVGLWTLRGRPRAGQVLFGTTALFLLAFPIVTKGYDYRFVIPAYAPLAAAAALGVWGLVGAITRRQRRARPDSPPSAPAPTVAQSDPLGSR
jgi:hypothetical protein